MWVMCVVWVHRCVYVWVYGLRVFMDGVCVCVCFLVVRVYGCVDDVGGIFCELWWVCMWYGRFLGVWAYVCIDDAGLWDV